MKILQRTAPYAILFLATLALYTLTLNRDVQPADSGELQLAAITFAVPHPPGYPLFTMLGGLFSLIPTGSLFARVSFLSAVVSAGTLVVLAACVRIFRPSSVCAFAAALVLAGSTTFWAQATTTNIRSLTTLFAALLLLTFLRFTQNTSRPTLVAFALTFGFAVGHHLSLVFVGGWLLCCVFLIGIRRAQCTLSWRDGALALACLLATQAVWLYLPLRNTVPSPLAHGNLRTLQGFADHVLARGFGGDLFYFITTEPQRFWDRLSLFPMLLHFQFGTPLSILIGVCAVVVLIKKNTRTVGSVLWVAFALHMFVTLMYRAPQTVEYAMPSWIIACVLLGAGLDGIACSVLRIPFMRNQTQRFVPQLLFVIALLFAGLNLIQQYSSFARLSRDRSTRLAAESVLRYTNRNETVLAQWHQATAMWALQAAENVRPDVRVVYVAPQGAEAYETTFAKTAAQAAQQGSTYSTSFFADEFAAQRLQTFPLSNTPAWRVASSIEIATANFPRTVWDNRIILVHPLGVPKEVEVGSQFNIDLWYSARFGIQDGDSISVRIMRPDGGLATNADVQLRNANGGTAAFARKVLAVPLNLPPGNYDILAGSYNGSTLYKTKDGADFVRVGGIRVHASSQSPISQHPLNTGNVLGVDYDTGIAGQLRVLAHFRLADSPAAVEILDANGSGLAPAQSLFSQTTPLTPTFQTLIFDVPPQGNLQLKISVANKPGFSKKPVLLATIALPNYTAGERYVPFANQMVLVGSSSFRRNSVMNIDLQWLSATEITDDYRTSVRVRGENFFVLHDSVPALGALPTLKWIRGSWIVDRHPAELGAYDKALQGDVVVYEQTSRLPLLPLDERYVDGVWVSVN